jgi:GNAT superfamily N-acetyltransferase
MDERIQVREALDDELPQVVALLESAFGHIPDGARTVEFFRWKHRSSPFGRSLLLVATDGPRVVGLRTLMLWRLRAGGRTIAALRGVDSATHPAYQGRGVFSRLTREILELARGQADLLFNNPNDESRSAYLRLGWELAGWMPIWIRVRRPVRVLLGARTVNRQGPGGTIEVDAAPVARALDDPRLADLLDEYAERDGRLRTDRDVAYLRWRYAEPPGLDHRVVIDERGGELLGVAVLRVRPRGRLWEGLVLELFTRPGDRDTARRLVTAAVRAAPVDFVASSFAARPPRSVRRPGGVALAIRTSGPVEPDPSHLASWDLALGDVEQL